MIANEVWSLVLVEIALVTTCFVGDHVTFHTPFVTAPVRALSDSCTHAAVAFLSWLAVRHNNLSDAIVEACVCALMSSFIDLDHFIAARSMHLKDALSLPTRPPLHNSSIMIITSLLLLVVFSHLHVLQVSTDSPLFPLKYAFQDFIAWLTCALKHCLDVRLAWIFTIAWISHHVRDANRRGIWLDPFGSTPPVPYTVYVLITMIVPLIVMQIIAKWHPDILNKQVYIDTSSPVLNV